MITLESAVDRYGKTINTFTSGACIYRKTYGKHPKWYINKGSRIYVDVDEYERLGLLERRAWMYATDKLYWIFEEIGLSMTDVSKLLSEKSKIYKSHKSWNSFLSNNLFMIPPDIISGDEKSMRLEFVQNGTRIIYEMIKKGELNGTM
jgi:hypothetical protein